MLAPRLSNGWAGVALVCLMSVSCGGDRVGRMGTGSGGGATQSGGTGGAAGAGGTNAGGADGCVQQVAASWTFTCAVKVEGSLWCWGEAGNAFHDGFSESAHPYQLTSLGLDVVQIAAGWQHACALTKGGAVLCWGSDDAGQLGHGGGASPGAISSDALLVSSRHKHTCAVKSDGSVWCWGSNYFGQIGDGTTIDQPLPSQVGAITSGTKVTAGENHSCAATSDRTIWCWGLNSHGQLGDGTTDNKLIPTPVLELATPAVELTAGVDFTCALEQGGSLWCWGEGAGNLMPTKIDGLDSVAHIGSGRLHICAVTTAGALWCWGDNYSGQLGNGTTEDQLAPVQVLDSGVAGVAGGKFHTCAVMSDGTLHCWGSNVWNQLADGTGPGIRTTPVPVVGLCP